MTTYMSTLKYFKGAVYLKFGWYENGRLGIWLMSLEHHDPVSKVTVNFPNVPLEDDEIIVKNYGENEGTLQFLQANNIVGAVIRMAENSFTKCPVVKLSKEILNQIPHQ